MKITAVLLLWFAIILFPSQASGNNARVNTEDFIAGTVMMNEMVRDHMPTRKELNSLKKEEKKNLRLERWFEKTGKRANAKMQRSGIDNIHDPVDRWFWIWGISWGLGILLSIFVKGSVVGAGIGLVWWLLFAFGSIALVVWLVKKFG